MAATKEIAKGAQTAADAIGAVLERGRRTPAGRALSRVGSGVGRSVRYLQAATPGAMYRFAQRRPDPNVPDDVLRDRVRAALGPVTRRLDVPRVHVLVEDHVVMLHGEVENEADARAIESVALRVSGIIGVESHLHIGLIPGDTRPSDGTRTRVSPALGELLDAARDAGAHDARAAVHAVLCGFTDRLPAGERDHVLIHLPADVRALAGPPRRLGERGTRVRTVHELVADVIARGGIEPTRADAITRLVLARLRDLVPEEARDVAAVLPPELREVWETQAAPQ